MTTIHQDFFTILFSIRLFDNKWNLLVPIKENTLLIVLKEKSVTKDDLLDLEDYSNKNLANFSIVLAENRIKPIFDKAFIEANLTNKIMGYELLDPKTNKIFWISNYDFVNLLTKIQYTQNLEEQFNGTIRSISS